MWTWQQATVISAVLAAGWVLLTRRGLWLRAQPTIHELALIIGLYALWQLAGALASGSAPDAIVRGRWIWDAERTLYLPSEVWLQSLILPHPLLAEAANLYYYAAHFTVLILFLIWLFIRHRDAYPRWRTTLGIVTTACFLIQFLPVAPPRLVPGIRVVDTAALYHQSVYATSVGSADELSAMPSVHVAWALFVAVCALRVTTSRWRYLGIVHAVLTTWVVVVTGNHYWGDAIVAAALFVLTLAAQRCTRALWPRVSPGLRTRVEAWSSTSRWGVRTTREGGGGDGGHV